MRGDIGLKFEDLTYIDFLDRDKLTIDVRKLIQTTKNKSGKHSLSETDLLDDIKRLEMAGHDPWHMCCGHDLLNVLAVGLRKALGSHNPSEVTPAILERSLRLAFDPLWFRQAKLYRNITLWEAAHNPYTVLRKNAS